MSEPYIAEIRPFAFGLVPSGWLPCNGQILQISANQALFSLLGTTYGGNGTTTFALPNLNGRTPVHPGPGMPYGQPQGEENHTLTLNELPAHSHGVLADSSDATSRTPVGGTWAAQANTYGSTPEVPMNPSAIAVAGGNQGHNNMQPFLVFNFCIAVRGIYPTRS